MRSYPHTSQQKKKVRGDLYTAPYASETEGNLIASLSDIKITAAPKELQGGTLVHSHGSITCNSNQGLEGLVNAGGYGYYIELENGEKHRFAVRPRSLGLIRREDGSFLIETTR